MITAPTTMGTQQIMIMVFRSSPTPEMTSLSLFTILAYLIQQNIRFDTGT